MSDIYENMTDVQKRHYLRGLIANSEYTYTEADLKAQIAANEEALFQELQSAVRHSLLKRDENDDIPAKAILSEAFALCRRNGEALKSRIAAAAEEMREACAKHIPIWHSMAAQCRGCNWRSNPSDTGHHSEQWQEHIRLLPSPQNQSVNVEPSTQR